MFFVSIYSFADIGSKLRIIYLIFCNSELEKVQSDDEGNDIPPYKGHIQAGSFMCNPAPRGKKNKQVKNTCKLCPKMHETKHFASAYPKRKDIDFMRGHDITFSANCRSTYCIYLVTCKKCGKQYVGSSEQTLQQRHNLHRRQLGITPKHKGTSISHDEYQQENFEQEETFENHFFGRDDKDIKECGYKNFSIQIIDEMPEKEKFRRLLHEKEDYWIVNLYTHRDESEMGLNARYNTDTSFVEKLIEERDKRIKEKDRQEQNSEDGEETTQMDDQNDDTQDVKKDNIVPSTSGTKRKTTDETNGSTLNSSIPVSQQCQNSTRRFDLRKRRKIQYNKEDNEETDEDD